MRAIITRHYKTIQNAADEIMGWGDAPRHSGWRGDLDFVEARFQRQAWAFDAVYSSDLERARQTALFYAQRRDIDVIHSSAALNEVNYGKLYKRKKKWVADHYPKHKKDPDLVYPDGESFRQMQTRSVEFITSMAQMHQHDTVLIVVHAGVIRGLISHFLKLNYADHLQHKISHRYIGKFIFDGSECVRYNEKGERSGFVTDKVLKLPVDMPTAHAGK